MTPEQQAMQDKREVFRGREERASAKPRPPARFGWGIGCLAAFVGAAWGAVAGGYIGSTLAPPPDPNAMLDLSGIGSAFDGAMIGFVVGPIVLVGLLYGLMGTWPKRRPR